MRIFGKMKGIGREASRVYLDHNATMPLRAEARAAMIAAMDVVGNPSSVHAEGRAAKALMERARAQVAEAAGAQAADIVFVSARRRARRWRWRGGAARGGDRA
jgi:cysteine desulfurase